MTVRNLIVSVPNDTLLANARLPTVPYFLGIDADETDLAILSAKLHYRRSLAGATHEPYATPRWECSLTWDDGRIDAVTFRPERPDPKHAYDELLEFLVTVTLFAGNLETDDRRKVGLLICGKSLLALWRDGESRLRPALTPPYRDAFI